MYDTRRLIAVIVGLIVAFALLLVLAFYIYPIINPDVNMGAGQNGVYQYDYALYGPQAVSELTKKVEALEKEVEERREKEMRDIAMIDSLFQVTMDLENELALAQANNLVNSASGKTGEKYQDPKALEVAKSLLRVDEDQLRQILSRLKDDNLVQVYQVATNSQRVIMLSALDPGKAAEVTRRALRK